MKKCCVISALRFNTGQVTYCVQAVSGFYGTVNHFAFKNKTNLGTLGYFFFMVNFFFLLLFFSLQFHNKCWEIKTFLLSILKLLLNLLSYII